MNCDDGNICQIFKAYDDEELEDKINVFKALSDPTRLNILYILENKELCSCEINKSLNKAQPTISHHIKILKKANLIKGRKKGTWIYYSLKKPEIINLIKEMTED